MKREEEYCDVCGKLISHYKYKTSDGKEIFGITTKLRGISNSYEGNIENPLLTFCRNTKTDCGSHSYATSFRPGSYCSERCFLEHSVATINEFLNRGDSGFKLQVISSK